jgi:hypothetical protein
MKTIIALLMLAAAPLALANGIGGKITDKDGNGRGGVKVTVKGYSGYVLSDSSGFYVISLPPTANGTRVNVYVNGTFAVNCLVPPEDGCNSTVNVIITR